MRQYEYGQPRQACREWDPSCHCDCDDCCVAVAATARPAASLNGDTTGILEPITAVRIVALTSVVRAAERSISVEVCAVYSC